MKQACSFSDVFASQAVSRYTFPWQPRRSDLLHARGSGTWRLSRAGSFCSPTLHSTGRLGTATVAGPCEGTQPRRELLLAAPNGEPHSRGERFGAGKRHPGSEKLTASLRNILLESFLHLLLSPRVICMQIKHGW